MPVGGAAKGKKKKGKTGKKKGRKGKKGKTAAKRTGSRAGKTTMLQLRKTAKRLGIPLSSKGKKKKKNALVAAIRLHGR